MQERADFVKPLEQNFQQLVNEGLLRLDPSGAVHGVES